MVFSDILFIYLFLPICFGMYFINSNQTYRNVILVIFSLIFYAWGEPLWVFLLLFISILDYNNGMYISQHLGTKKATARLAFSIVVNLTSISVFKYGSFIMTNINALFGLELPVPDISLPIGISFYTFQTITYIVDVYRGRVKSQKNYLNYLLYLSLFFQLVAGPIVRYSTVNEEINSRKATTSEFQRGLTRFIYGLAKKVIIANTVGEIATTVLTIVESSNSSVFAAWFGVAMYALQIYFDFSGYSDMAIGMGLMCGFHFLENFNYPYISKSVTEFWRRWHISLGSFFKDYVYIPLGGNQKHQMLNLAIVWGLTGLWHGASWNFILWGFYFGILIVLEKLFLLKVLEKIPAVFSHIYLIFIALIGWNIFYHTDITLFYNCFKTMFGINDAPLIDAVSQSHMMNNLYLIIIALILCTPVYRYIKMFTVNVSRLSITNYAISTCIRTVYQLFLLIVSTVLLVGQTYNPSIYFRF